MTLGQKVNLYQKFYNLLISEKQIKYYKKFQGKFKKTHTYKSIQE